MKKNSLIGGGFSLLVALAGPGGARLEKVDEFPCNDGPWRMDLTSDGTVGLVSNAGSNQVTFLQMVDRTVITALSVSSSLPRGVAIAPNDEVAYVANSGSRSVWAIDMIYRYIIDEIDIEEYNDSVAFTLDSSRAFVTGEEHVFVIKAEDHTVEDTLDLDAAEVAVNPVSGKVWFTGGSIQIYDPDTLAQIDTIGKGGIIHPFRRGSRDP